MLIKLKPKYKSERITSAMDAFEIFREQLMELDMVERDKEYMWVLGLRNDNRPRYLDLVGIGTLTSLVSGPREIFTRAIRIGGTSAIIMCHSHPSGNLKPSKEDEKFTQQVKQAGKILQIDLLDHLIISHRSYYSFFGVEQAQGGKND